MKESPSSRLFDHLLSQGINVSSVATELRNGAEVLVVELVVDGSAAQDIPVEFEDLEVVVKVSGGIVPAGPEARS